ncbi:MAG: hypothetical protein ACJ8BW_11805 [Ktedonobacteraceae bacterium]
MYGKELVITELSVPLTALSEDQRAQVHTRLTIIRPVLEDDVTHAQGGAYPQHPGQHGQAVGEAIS